MNLTRKTTTTEFRSLLAACDDEKFSHKLWVSHDGEVHFTAIPLGSNIGPYFDEKKLGAKFHLETFPYAGNYTGQEAVKDKKWVDRLHTALKYNWAEGTTGYVDIF